MTAASERVITLQRQFDSLVEELKQLKQKIYELRRENEFLEKEAHQTRLESQEYTSYMSKRAQKRQNQIISLTDQNHLELENIKKQKEKILAEYEEKLQELGLVKLEKENELAQINKQIDSLGEFKELRENQLSRISELQKEVMEARAEHAENLHKIKVNFLQEKADYKQNAMKMVKALEKEANREAVCCLIKHIEFIKSENQQLRQELLCQIRRSGVLRARRLELEEQHQQLLREKQYSTKLKRLRCSRLKMPPPPEPTVPSS
uniref:Coiled-coil domain-containing protein 166-like n=2 Tax=Callorhinchus milii TaxID=7868 RepID=V9KSQ0_CALMI